MNDPQWEDKLKDFLKRTGDDFKRFGNDVKGEAQRLLSEVKDPERQQKMKDGLKQVGVWAKRTAEDVATVLETGVKKAETAFVKASEKVKDFAGTPSQEETPVPVPSAPAGHSARTAVSDTPKPNKKTIGGKKRKSTSKAAPAKKTMGKKK